MGEHGSVTHDAMAPAAPASDRSPRAPKAPSIDRRLLSEIAPARRALVVSIVVGVVLTATLIAQAILLAHLLGWAMSNRSGPFPVTIAIGFGVAVVVRAGMGTLGEAVAASAGSAVTTELRRRVLSSAVERGPVWLASQRIGSITLGVTRGLRALEPYFSRYLPAAVIAVLAPPVTLIVLGLIDWPSALIALGLLAVVPFAMVRFGRSAARESERQWRRLSSMSGRTLELVRGLPTLKALGRVRRGRDELAAASSSVADSVNATLRASMTSTAALEFLAGVGVGLVAMCAGLRLLDGSMHVVPALTVILLTPEVFLPLRRAGAEFHASTEGRSAASAAYEVIDASPRAAEGPRAMLSSLTPLVIDDLEIRFPGAPTPAISSLSFSLEHGEHLVISGPSGSGKTSLLLLLCGFLTPSAGSVSAGGLDLSSVDPASLRSMVSLVPQRPHVFAASLQANLDPLGQASSHDLAAALELVGLEHLADRSHGGLDRPLAEGGRSLSAGERQRLGIARVILQDRPVVLFDEATEHLDAATARRLAAGLSPWLAGRTVIEAGHRPRLLGPDASTLSMPVAEGPR